ncbi:MAG: MarR family transcriptional regulator [Microlunatus sp.]
MAVSTGVGRAALLAQLDALHTSFDRRALSSLAGPLMSTPLTMQQLKVLTLIATEGDRATGHGLAETLRVSVATMSGLIDRLVEHGMVVRTDDPNDRRIRRLSVTGIGSGALRSLLSSSSPMPPQVIERLSDDDLRALVQGLLAVDQVMEELNQAR